MLSSALRRSRFHLQSRRAAAGVVAPSVPRHGWACLATTLAPNARVSTATEGELTPMKPGLLIGALPTALLREDVGTNTVPPADVGQSAVLTKDRTTCLEDPYNTKEELLAQSNLIDAHDGIFSSTATHSSYSYLLHVPKSFLNVAGEKYHGRRWKSNSNFGIEKKLLENQVFYHATFTDPVTKEQFSSGLGREIKAEMSSAALLSTPLHRAEVHIFDGQVYYRHKKLAEHAAAARAIDCYIFREEKQIPHKLCLEEPYYSTAKRDSQQINYDEILSEYFGNTGHNFIRDPRDSSLVDTSEVDRLLALHVQFCMSGKVDAANGILDELRSIHSVIVHDLSRTWSKGGKGHGFIRHPRDSSTVDVYEVDRLLASRAEFRRSKDFDAADSMLNELRSVHGVIVKDNICLWAVDVHGHGFMRDPQDSLMVDVGEVDRLLASRAEFRRSKDFDAADSILNELRSVHSVTVWLKNCMWAVDVKGHGFMRDPRDSLMVDVGEVDRLLASRAEFRRSKDFDAADSILNELRSVHGVTVWYYNHMWAVDVKGHGFMRDPQDSLMVDVGEVDRLLASRAKFRRSKDFDAADNILDELGSIHGVTLCDKTRTWAVGEADRLLASCAEDILNEPTSGHDMTTLNSDRTLGYTSTTARGGSDLRDSTRNNHMSTKEQVQDTQASDFPASTFSSSYNLSTIGRIAEIWTDTAGTDYSRGTSRPWSVQSTIEYKDSLSPMTKIEGICDWYQQLNKEPQNYGEASALAQLCTKILTALGKAITELNFDEKDESSINAQKKANSILLKVISLAKSYDRSFLNAHVFNAYIHCLRSSNPNRSATTAQHFLKCMENHEKYYGINLPTPNIETYNAAMALWALEEGIAGQNGVNNVYTELVRKLHSSSHLVKPGSGGDCSLRPNNDTFKTLLAVNSKTEDGRFSFDRAKMWLDRIEHISNSINGQAFIPDTNIYYAALGSLCGSSKDNSTDDPNTTSLLRYGKQYDGGFNVDEHSNAEAVDIAKWLLHAEEGGVNPNVEMYEAVIQAWTETGTKDGLLMAEDWAKRAVLSSTPIRLETFHPTIAAWALCQLERAPERVGEWIRQLYAVGATKPHLNPDLNTLSAQIVAWRNVQAGQIVKLEQSENERNKISRNTEMVFAAAQNCTQLLEEILLNWREEGEEGPEDSAALLLMFTHTIQAWGCASRFSLRQTASSLSLDESQGVNEILKIAKLFPSEIDDNESKEYSKQIPYLMGMVYAEIASQLHQIDSAVDASPGEANAACHFCDNIDHVEKLLLDYEMSSRKHSQSNAFTPASKAIRFRFYNEILRGCVKSTGENGDVVRLFNMIMEHLSWQNENFCQTNGFVGSPVEEQDITDMYIEIALLTKTVVNSPCEQMDVLTAVHNNASPFFSRKRMFKASSYATVDSSRLLGAMRMAMGDSELTQSFISSFDKQLPERKPREITAMSFVREMMSQSRRKREVNNRN